MAGHEDVEAYMASHGAAAGAQHVLDNHQARSQEPRWIIGGLIDQSIRSPMSRLLESGEHADLVIRTKTRDFKVHKCIVSTRSGFFKGVTRNHFKEETDGVVYLEEPAGVIEAVLQHIYGAPISFVSKPAEDEIDSSRSVALANVRLALRLPVAIDKYLVEDFDMRLMSNVIMASFKCLDIDHVDDLRTSVQMAIEVFGNEGKVEVVLALSVLSYLATDLLGKALRDPESWSLLIAQPQILKAVTEGALAEADYRVAIGGSGGERARLQEAEHLRSVYERHTQALLGLEGQPNFAEGLGWLI